MASLSAVGKKRVKARFGTVRFEFGVTQSIAKRQNTLIPPPPSATGSGEEEKQIALLALGFALTSLHKRETENPQKKKLQQQGVLVAQASIFHCHAARGENGGSEIHPPRVRFIERTRPTPPTHPPHPLSSPTPTPPGCFDRLQ